MMPEWHQLDSSTTMSEQQESAKKKTLKSSSRLFWFSTGLAAGINHFITSELIRYINRSDSYNVAIGHYTPRQIEPQIILKFPSRESDYLLNN